MNLPAFIFVVFGYHWMIPVLFSNATTGTLLISNQVNRIFGTLEIESVTGPICHIFPSLTVSLRRLPPKICRSFFICYRHLTFGIPFLRLVWRWWFMTASVVSLSCNWSICLIYCIIWVLMNFTITTSLYGSLFSLLCQITTILLPPYYILLNIFIFHMPSVLIVKLSQFANTVGHVIYPDP